MMIKLILTALAALALAACAMAPSQPVAGQAEPGKPLVVGTLAPEHSFEWRAAPSWTQLLVLRHRTARLLDAKAIDVATAKRIQALADEARAKLDEAAKADTAGDAARAERALLDAQMKLTTATAALGGKR